MKSLPLLVLAMLVFASPWSRGQTPVLESKAARSGAPAPRPRLQLFNASAGPIDIFWLKTDAERILNGSLEPGQNTVLTTTIGHRFLLVGRAGRGEERVTSSLPVQAFVYQPLSESRAALNSIPADVVMPPPPQLKLPPFYKKFISAQGYPIIASAKVNDYALKEAAFLVNLLLARRPDVRAAMIQSGSRMCLMAYDEYTTDLPEFGFLAKDPVAEFPGVSPKDFWDARARGTGGSETDPYCSSAEENLLGYPGDPYAAECILIHEFAHNVHLRGMVNVDPTFDARLKATYDAAMKAGLWKGKYAAVNHHEYFAEGVQSWFDNNRVNDHDHNHVNTRALLLEYDPGLATMCREVFGDTVIKYTKPATRLTGHLAGYDPTQAPKFVWPERLAKAKDGIKRQAVARDAAGKAGGDREIRQIAGWTVKIHRELLEKESAATKRALELLKVQLEEIIRVVPAGALAELRQVPLWFSPEYPGVRPTAEYHPGADWLSENKRDPGMAKGVEITDVRDFEKEMNRMPNFILHELAHGYHDRVLAGGFENVEIKAAYARAKASKSYDKVERWLGNGRPNTFEKAYAMTNPMEYFAETTEAFFSRNDFFPFTRVELRKHDPEMEQLLSTLWGATK